ncbi:MAG: hypothetical protein EA407_00925 [Rhodobacteraceae bacterium]|nr:MAG: hypothetical protein EA407_00925 [Paracoccaceae bacterium]
MSGFRTKLQGFALLALLLAPVTVQAEVLHIRLDKASTVAGQCQLVFVLENGTQAEFEQLQAEVVLLNRETRVLRLSLMDFQSLPANGLRVRSFNLPDLDCAEVGRVLFNAMGPCTPLEPRECTEALRVSSDTGIEVLK